MQTKPLILDSEKVSVQIFSLNKSHWDYSWPKSYGISVMKNTMITSLSNELVAK